jgi:hypothetical protein
MAKVCQCLCNGVKAKEMRRKLENLGSKDVLDHDSGRQTVTSDCIIVCDMHLNMQSLLVELLLELD